MKSEPSIEGRHNANFDASQTRILKGSSYKDCSTVIVIPTRGSIPIRVVMAWRNLIQPMNQKVVWFPVVGMEVGEAYTAAVTQILAHPDLSKFTYMLTLEEDNLPPPDGLIKLIEAIDSDKRLSAVGALYWTKGDGGQPMCYGHPSVMPKNFIPFMPPPDSVVMCNGIGMGFSLFRISMFKDERIPKPWFKTVQQYDPSKGSACFTQDLYFCEQAGKAGHTFACDSRVRVGHLDPVSDIVW